MVMEAENKKEICGGIGGTSQRKIGFFCVFFSKIKENRFKVNDYRRVKVESEKI